MVIHVLGSKVIYMLGSVLGVHPLVFLQFFRYWPESGISNFGSVQVMVESESAEHLYTTRKIRLTNIKVVRRYTVTVEPRIKDTAILFFIDRSFSDGPLSEVPL